MPQPTTTIGLTVLTLMALAASVLAIVRLLRPSTHAGLGPFQYSLTGLCILGTGGLFAYRALWINEAWQPLGAHVDGLLGISAIFAVVVLLMQRASIRGLSAFALPLFTILLAWAICASFWTYEPFETRSLWMATHRAGVYLGTLFFCIAAAAGGMYLYIQHRLHQHRDATSIGHLASLESVERLNITMATIGFALLTLGLITGLIIQTSEPQTRLGAGWWHSPKILLSAAVWLIYAVVMNVRYATAFRGARAAWLSIAGLVLLAATFGAVQALPDLPRDLDHATQHVATAPPWVERS